MTHTSRIVVAFLLFALCACSSSYHGGGTVGTGLPGGGRGEAAEYAGDESGEAAAGAGELPAVDMALSGSLHDEHGKALRRVPLVIRTPRETKLVVTDAQGRFSTVIRSGDTVSFAIDGKRESELRWKVPAHGPSHEPPSVRLVYSLDRKLRLEK